MKLPFSRKNPDSFEQDLESIESFSRFQEALRETQQEIKNNPSVYRVNEPVEIEPFAPQHQAAIQAVGEAALQASAEASEPTAKIIPFRPRR